LFSEENTKNIFEYRLNSLTWGVSDNMSQLWMTTELYTKKIIKKKVHYNIQYINICCTWAKTNRTTYLFSINLWLYYKNMDNCYEWILHKQNWIMIMENHVKCKTNTIPILVHQMRISTNQVSSVMLRSKNLEIRKKMWKLWKSRQMKTKHSAMKLSQIHRRIELCMR
jgi:hypothetical protein